MIIVRQSVLVAAALMVSACQTLTSSPGLPADTAPEMGVFWHSGPYVPPPAPRQILVPAGPLDQAIAATLAAFEISHVTFETPEKFRGCEIVQEFSLPAPSLSHAVETLLASYPIQVQLNRLDRVAEVAVTHPTSGCPRGNTP